MKALWIPFVLWGERAVNTYRKSPLVSMKFVVGLDGSKEISKKSS